MSARDSGAIDSGVIHDAVHATLDGAGRVVVAVSGGIDSMVLVHAAATVLPKGELVAATLDHGTGAAASAARAQVERWCSRASIECVSERVDRALATEADFRDARWSFLRRVADSPRARIATAHTADDQVETVVLRILRGAGARGIAGLFAASDILRPLLAFTRGDIRAYAARHRIQWVEDPTNVSPRFFRNRVRHDLLPALSRARPELRAELLALSHRAAAWRADLDDLLRRDLSACVLPNRGGLDVPVDRLRGVSRQGLAIVWPAVAAQAGVVLDRRAIARLVELTEQGRVGARAQISGGWEVVRSRDALQLRASGQEAMGEAVVPTSSGIRWGAWSIRPAGAVGMDAWSAWLPSDAVLTIRPWRAGDVLARSGSGVRQRKVKVLLSKAGVTGHERTAWPVVLAGSEIVWIPGVGRSDAATVRSGRPVLAFACEHSR